MIADTGQDLAALRDEVFARMTARPERTVGDLLNQLAGLPRTAVVRIDIGGGLNPEQVRDLGLVPATDRNAGNNVRWFGFAVGEGVVYLEC